MRAGRSSSGAAPGRPATAIALATKVARYSSDSASRARPHPRTRPAAPRARSPRRSRRRRKQGAGPPGRRGRPRRAACEQSGDQSRERHFRRRDLRRPEIVCPGEGSRTEQRRDAIRGAAPGRERDRNARARRRRRRRGVERQPMREREDDAPHSVSASPRPESRRRRATVGDDPSARRAARPQAASRCREPDRPSADRLRSTGS